MKLSAIINRGTRRDFIDLFRLCRELELEGLLELSEKKFPRQTTFQVQALKALVYFEDAQSQPLELELLEPVDWNELTNYFESQVRQLNRRWFG